jgi:hypothetical protein
MGTENSKSLRQKLGNVSKGFLNSGFQIEEVTNESLIPDSFRRIVARGTEK